MFKKLFSPSMFGFFSKCLGSIYQSVSDIHDCFHLHLITDAAEHLVRNHVIYQFTVYVQCSQTNFIQLESILLPQTSRSKACRSPNKQQRLILRCVCVHTYYTPILAPEDNRCSLKSSELVKGSIINS